MGHETNILLKIKNDISTVTNYLSSILKVEFEISLLDEEVSYSSSYKNENIYIYDCSGFEDDCGIEFSNFNYLISVESYIYSNNENKITSVRQQLCYEIADDFFKKYKCNILIIEGLQIKLKEFKI